MEGGGGVGGPLKEWKRCKRIERPNWGMTSSLDAIGFVARSKVMICGFMFGREKLNRAFVLKV